MLRKFIRVLDWLDVYVTRVERIGVLLAGGGITVLAAVASINRYVFKFNMPWYEEIVIVMYFFLVFWGASLVAKRGSHLKVDLLEELIEHYFGEHSVVLRIHKLTVIFICLVVSGLGVFYLMKFSIGSTRETPILGIPTSLTYGFTIVAGFAGLFFRYLHSFVRHLYGVITRNNGEESTGGRV